MLSSSRCYPRFPASLFRLSSSVRPCWTLSTLKTFLQNFTSGLATHVTLLRVLLILASPRLQLQHGPLADGAINISTCFTIWCVVLSSLEHCWNNACTSFNSPRQCEVKHHQGLRDCDGALGVRSSYFSPHVKVGGVIGAMMKVVWIWVGWGWARREHHTWWKGSWHSSSAL